MSILRDPRLNLLCVAVLVSKLGGEVTITQEDIDKIAFNRLDERMEDGILSLKVTARTLAS